MKAIIFFERYGLSLFVGVLIIAQIVLVGIVIVNVKSSSRLLKQSEEYYEECAVYLDSLRDVIAQRDSTQVVFASPIAELPPKEDNSATITSIILALITLCVTLSIVIPYVEGKSMTEGKVKAVASNYYKDAFESIEQYYSKTRENTLWEEGHFSRMIAFLLQKGNSSDQEMLWSIGWASKAFIRYINSPDNFHKSTFIEDSIAYINAAATHLSNIESDFSDSKTLDKILRAFVDTFDAYVMIKNDKYLKQNDEIVKNIDATLLLLYKTFSQSFNADEAKASKDVKEELRKATVGKSKFFNDETLAGKRSRYSKELEDFFAKTV